jgi:polyhydroxybutyrate depolymerase
MDATADREGLVVVYPNGIDNRWKFGASGFDGEVDDVGFARAVVEDLGERGCFDTSRVYATGSSSAMAVPEIRSSPTRTVT